MKEKKRKIKTHQWSLNLTSWCLSHWSMIMIYFVLWTVFKYFFLSCYPVLIMVKFSGSMFLLWIHKHGPYFISDSILFCLFVFIHFSCSWVTKYLECESLCSSCTKTEIIAMIIKKNMTKLYMHHFHGGRVYCCIVIRTFCF